MGQTWLGRIKSRERREGEVLAAQRAVQRAILVRFPEASPSLIDRVEQIRNVTVLETLHRQAILAKDLAEIAAQLPS